MIRILSTTCFFVSKERGLSEKCRKSVISADVSLEVVNNLKLLIILGEMSAVLR